MQIFNGNRIIGRFTPGSFAQEMRDINIETALVDIARSCTKIVKVENMGLGIIIGEGLMVGWPYSKFSKAYFAPKDNNAN